VKVAIVSGGRDYQDRDRVWMALDAFDPSLVIEGGCPTGADRYAREWCYGRWGLYEITQHLHTYQAEWRSEGGEYHRSAGPIRNKLMARVGSIMSEGHCVTAFVFPGGRGTQSFISAADGYRLRIERIG
jgi:hypothetical protein